MTVVEDHGVMLVTGKSISTRYSPLISTAATVQENTCLHAD